MCHRRRIVLTICIYRHICISRARARVCVCVCVWCVWCTRARTYVRACVHACICACMRAYVRVCASERGVLFCYFIGYPRPNTPAGLTKMLPVRALLVQRKDGRAYLSPSEEFVWAMMAIHISVRGHAIYQTSIIESLSFLID